MLMYVPIVYRFIPEINIFVFVKLFFSERFSENNLVHLLFIKQ